MIAAAPAALAQVEADVRELLVRRELPLDEDHSLRTLVDEVVADYRERYLDGGIPPLAEHEVELLRQRILGFGALTPFFDDPDVEEIWVNEPGRVFVARHGEHELTGLVLEPRDVEEIVERMLARAGRRLDRSQPFVDARLPDGSRLHVAIPPITDHWSVNVRKFVGLRAHSCAELVELGSCSPTAARFLDASVRASL
jgi:pilus assembly protein CpaF